MEKKETAKERILRAAGDLFYREGMRAVGVDRIIAESGVAKASFYRNFATKDDLIVAYLEQRHARNMDNLQEALRRYPNDPLEQLRFLIRRLIERMQSPDYRGCAFMNTSVEFPELEHPGHQVAVGRRNELWTAIREIAGRTRARDPEELTGQLSMLSSGAMMVAYMNREAFNYEYFEHAAQTLIDRQVEPLD
ncbi:TetR/AcrR family transcriptional regulator [Paenibacillus athensensis]|uniref:TetR family transcriptional regulator n=1 Tax=Paenibacillus athensensis TaxID=1967502 RepID=A0A4Y8Q8H0_9BACL|nr:TetR/AcrR family transcriptional regulator [Paenibacillus athensensis]MCD1259995.1 TetR/AcrR family transcriptional regulator [Paenibacillus athensensis]